MGSRRNCSRSELWRLLQGDFPPSDVPPKAPDENSLILLHEIISLGATGTADDARAVYEHLPLLILRFFGFAASTGWLETGSDLPYSHREALMSIIGPDGPVMAFCTAHSPALSEPKSDDMRYEFPVRNLSSVIAEEITDLADGEVFSSQVDSALAPFVSTCLRRDSHDRTASTLLLSPMDYFILCMVSSPVFKWTYPSGSGSRPGRRPRGRRSASLPSTRAMYNCVFASHLASVDYLCPVASSKSLLVPASIDCMFYPLASVISFDLMPNASTPTADAMATVLVSLRPSSPEKLLLSSRKASGHGSPGRETSGAAVFAYAHDALKAVFMYFPVGVSGPLSTLAAYVRLLAIYLAPWDNYIASSLHVYLFPKPRVSSAIDGSGIAAHSFTAITSRLSSLNSSLPVKLQSGSRKSSPSVSSDPLWSDCEVLRAKREVDQELVCLAIMKCAHCRLGGSMEGIRALSLMSDAVRISGITGKVNFALLPNTEEVSSCLHALGDQIVEADRRSGKKSRDFVSELAATLGIELQGRGMFSGMASIVGVSGAAAGMVGLVSHVTGGNAVRRPLRERRRTELHDASRENVPFLGTVWDKPIEAGESEISVVFAYRLALWIEEKIGILPNIRFLGRKDVICTIVFILFATGYVTTIRSVGA